MKVLLELFLTFAKIGAVTFGGGYAMLPILQREIVERRHWATEEELLNYFAIGQCTPGIIFMNTATFIGYQQKRILGGAAATLGGMTPSICIILLIASVLENYADLQVVQSAFAGIRVVVLVLILQAVVGLYKKSAIDTTCKLVAVSTFVAVGSFGVSPATVVMVVIVCALIHSFVKNRENLS